MLGVDLNADVVLATTGQTHQLEAVGGAGELLAVAHAVQENLKACHTSNCFPIHAMCLVLVATTHAAPENRTSHTTSSWSGRGLEASDLVILGIFLSQNTGRKAKYLLY